MRQPNVRKGALRWRVGTWRDARLDARRDLPAPETTVLGESERQIQAAVNRSIRTAQQRYASKANPLNSERLRLRSALTRSFRPELDALEQRTGRRDVRSHIGHSLHLVLLLLLTVGEGAFNLVAFNVFQEPAYYTILMALAVSLAIPICAWSVGVWVRQWPRPAWRTALKVVTVTGVLVAVLLGINEVRIAYLQAQAAEFVAAHPELSQAFLAVNLVILVAAMLVTYLAHDPEPGFAQARKRVHASELRLQRLDGVLGQLAAGLRAEAEMAKEAGLELIAYYRLLNRRGRDSCPRYYDEPSEPAHEPQFVVADADWHATPLPTQVEVVEPEPLPSIVVEHPLILTYPGALNMMLRRLAGIDRR